MRVLAVDLAAKYSAACYMDGDFRVHDQFDSWSLRPRYFVEMIADFWSQFSLWPPPNVVVIEDLPHSLKYSKLIKDVCRLQGRIIHAMDEHDRVGKLLFLAPAEWKRTYKGLERGTPPSAVVDVAAGLGYTPPDLTSRAASVKGGKAIARKVTTDYCSAYLIARWAITTHHKAHTFDVVGTSRWNTDVIRKKDLQDA